ncbi:hypothetical protein MHK_000291 [Candidatus Magnetomorum sp. HK-1]|nr:hypothetical protein MHK_000291 [Candidatus Magnetomorum sp. HK-1]
MHISIDSKLKKLIDRKNEIIPESQSLQHCINAANHYLNHNEDCLLVASPASFKTQILLSVACSSPNQQKVLLILPSYERPYYESLFTSYSMKHIRIKTFRQAVENKVEDEQFKLIVIDEGEQIEDINHGEQLETFIAEICSDAPVLMGINNRSNLDIVAKWISEIRKRSCHMIHTQYPKKIIHTFLSSKGDWLPLLDKKKLNKKIKAHLKQKDNKRFKHKQFLLQAMDLLSTNNIFPALFVVSSNEYGLDMWQKCEIKEASPGKYLTIPSIVSHLENYSRLKDYPQLSEMIKKRAAFCSNDKPWIELVESLFLLNAFDIVFAAPDTIKQLYCQFRSIVFMGHPEKDGKDLNMPLSLWYDQLMMRLGIFDILSMDSQKQNFFCIVSDMPDVDPVILKDNLSSGPTLLKTQLKWTLQNVLRRIARKQPAMHPLEKSFLVACHGSQNDILFHDTIMELQAELPHAKCSPLIAMTFLVNIKTQWLSELTQIQHRNNKNFKKGHYAQQQKLRLLLDCLPCIGCKHESTCHQRGSRRFRELIDTFQKFRVQKDKAYLNLQMEYPIYENFLMRAGMITQNKAITPKGQIAYQLDYASNPLLMECLSEKTISMDDQNLGATLLAGFLSHSVKIKTGADLSCDKVKKLYEQIRPHLMKSAHQMLSIGLIPQMPDFQFSCLYFALTSNNVDQHMLLKETGLAQTDIALFLEKVDLAFSKVYIAVSVSSHYNL